MRQNRWKYSIDIRDILDSDKSPGKRAREVMDYLVDWRAAKKVHACIDGFQAVMDDLYEATNFTNQQYAFAALERARDAIWSWCDREGIWIEYTRNLKNQPY